MNVDFAFFFVLFQFRVLLQQWRCLHILSTSPLVRCIRLLNFVQHPSQWLLVEINFSDFDKSNYFPKHQKLTKNKSTSEEKAKRDAGARERTRDDGEKEMEAEKCVHNTYPNPTRNWITFPTKRYKLNDSVLR